MMVLSRKQKVSYKRFKRFRIFFLIALIISLKFSDLSAACLYHDLYLLFVSINNATAALPAKIRDGEK